MNLWIFNHYANGPGTNGVTRHYDLAKELVKKGHSVTIFCSSYNHWNKKELLEYENNEFFKIVQYENVRFVYFKTTPYDNNGIKRIQSMFSYYLKAKKFKYEQLGDKPDYVLGSLLHHLAALIGLKIARKYNAKFIFEERDLWPATLIDLGKLSVKNPVVKLLDSFEKYMYKNSDKIIVLFDKADQYVVSKGIDQSKILYLPNGSDLSRFDFLEIRNKKKTNVIGYIGAHSLANNMHRIIELAEYLKNDETFQFLFVGEGTYKEELIEIVKEKNLTNCKFKPAVPKEKIPEVLQECDYGIISLKDSPLYNYGFSLNKLYDYLGAKLPIILDTTITNNVVSENMLGVSSSDLDDIASKLKSMTDMEYQNYSENAYTYVQNNHSWESLASKFEEQIFNEGKRYE